MIITRELSWVLTLAWAANIFWMSGDAFNSYETRSVLARALALLHIHLSTAALVLVNVTIRKLAHAFEYLVLTLLMYGSLAGREHSRWQPGVARTCVLIACLVAAAQELQQIFVPSRGASVLDWALDVVGSCLGVALVYRWAGNQSSGPRLIPIAHFFERARERSR